MSAGVLTVFPHTDTMTSRNNKSIVETRIPSREGCSLGKTGEGGALERGVFLGSRAPFAGVACEDTAGGNIQPRVRRKRLGGTGYGRRIIRQVAGTLRNTRT